MNKIYLFLIALLATVGFTAKAADFQVNTNLQNSGWQAHDMNWFKDNGNEKQYYVVLTANSTTAQMTIVTSNGNHLKANNATINPNGTKGCDVKAVDNWQNINITGLTANKNYKIWLYYKSLDRNSNNDKNITHYVQIEETTEGGNTGGNDQGSTSNYYFYGDMNMWSSYLNAGEKVRIYSFEDEDKKNDLAEDVFNGNVPNWYTKAELDKGWMFKKIDAAHVYGSATVGSNWYYLDFANVYDGEGHKGRLCGQFKITMGNHDNDDNWGIANGGDNATYYGKVVNTNGTALTVNKGKGSQNIQLEANYVQNAILYFNPTTSQVMVKGTPVYNYVYYALTNGQTPTEAMINSCRMDVVSQLNYLVNQQGFNGTGITNVGGNKDTGSYHWESTTATHPVTKKTYNVLRRRIPSGATHRFPTQITVKFSDNYQGDVTTYPETRVLCDDIWFIRGTEVNVYFRYDDDEATKSLDWVCYNVFNNTFTADGIVNGYNYLFGGTKTRTATQPQITNGEYAVMQYVDSHKKPGDDKAHPWWKSPMPVPAAFTSNSWVIFGESRGGIYPVDRVKADVEDLGNVALNGEDLYFVATTRENPSLLYSHLNGTFKLSESDSKTVQINAEFYDPESVADPSQPLNLITHTGQVKYRFEIWKDGKIKASSGEFSEEPFWDWDMSDNSYVAGYYFVIVYAEYNGKIYTAQDTYAVY